MNHPCKHFGTGPGDTNSHLANSVNVFPHKINNPTRFKSDLPQIIADSTTPSSSLYVYEKILVCVLISI